MLVNERLYRDLRETERINTQLAALEALAPGTLDAAQLAAVKRVLAWERARHVDVIQIRPTSPLPGGPFTGFVDADLRAAYIDAGSDRASAVLRASGLAR